MRRSTINLFLLLSVVVVFSVALVLGAGRGEFGGTDAAAGEQIVADHNYAPWFEPVWNPPGGEVEAGLFALQAAIGGGILGFALGAYRERRKLHGDIVPERRHHRDQAGDDTAAKS